MNIKILQLGDLHLDAAYARLAPDRAEVRRKAARELLDEAVAFAEREDAAMILCTGDLFDTPSPYRNTVEAAVAAFRRARIPVFLTPGNHDPYTRTSPYFAADWSENVHIFTSETPETVSLPELDCEVTGVAFRSTAKLPPTRITRRIPPPICSAPDSILSPSAISIFPKLRRSAKHLSSRTAAPKATATTRPANEATP